MNDRNPTAAPPGSQTAFPENDSDTLTPALLKARLRHGDRLLGIDLGSKTIGLAVSDGLWMGATPLKTIRRSKFSKDSQDLLAIVEEYEVAALILGLPVEMDGSEGKRCQSTRQFAANLRGLGNRLSALPLAYWDERLSTAAVQRMMIDDFDMSRKKRAETVDKQAAAYILQGFMDAMSHVRNA
jgi:putative Holliday junction resolvase